MTINLKTLSMPDLKSLQSDVASEIESRQKEERQKLVQEFRDKAKSLGISLEELVAGQKSKGRSSSKVAAKYAHPADVQLTWTGRGKRPRWVNDWLAKGKSLDDLRV